MEPQGKKFGRVSGFAYTINSVIGAGFLSIPWAFQHAGWVLALCMQVLFLTTGWLLSDQLLEVTSRVESLKQYQERGNFVKPISVLKALAVGLTFRPSSPDYLLDIPDPMLSETRQYDLSEIVRILIGDCWAYVYLTCISLFLAGTLSAYVNIFATAFGSNAPLLTHCDYSNASDISTDCMHQYWIYVGVFFVMMVYFTSIEFHEQLWMQLAMTGMRCIVMSIIIVSCLVSLFTHQNLTNDDSYRSGDPPLAVFSTIGHTFPIFMFAAIYQTQYPGILSAIQKDKGTLKCNLTAVTLMLLFFYCAMGVTASLAISDVSSNVSLSFQKYSGGWSQAERPQWAVAISYLVVLFPAIDVISIFPIIGHAISDNVMSILFGSDRDYVRSHRKFAYYGLRIGCILPSFLYAFFEVKFGNIVNNSGLFCFYLTFFMIPLLHVAGKYLVRKPSEYDIPHNPLVTPTQWLSSLITIFSIPLLGLNIYSLAAAA